MTQVWACARSLAATCAISVDFSSSGYLDVSVPRVVLCRPISFGRRWRGVARAGLPHSEICGSRAECASPQLIAADHVLHRLPVPRHPPCALSIFHPLRNRSLPKDRTYLSDTLAFLEKIFNELYELDMFGSYILLRSCFRIVCVSNATPCIGRPYALA